MRAAGSGSSSRGRSWSRTVARSRRRAGRPVAASSRSTSRSSRGSRTPMPSEPRGRVVLPALPADAAADALASPWLPAAAIDTAALARRAAGVRVPVLLAVPEGAGRLRFARALHALGAASGPLVAVTGRRPTLDALPAGASLYLDVGRLAPEALVALDALLDDGLFWIL